MKLKVMSFNIRYAEATDGPDIWENRRPVCRAVIDRYLPDIVGTQEPEILQLQQLDEDLPDYSRFGVSRYGNEYEKFAAVYFRSDRLQLLESGAYWFSETPDEVGSMNWHIHKPYAANWARLQDKSSGFTFVVHNAQFPYLPIQAEARFHAAEIMVERSRSDHNVIFTGDFNCDAGGDVYNLLARTFQDASCTDRVLGPSATFHGFTGEPSKPYRLDWILYRGGFVSTSYETVTFNENGRYPSDHFPVMAELEFQEGSLT